MERIGLIGQGYAARVHANLYADVKDATVAAVASPIRLEEFARNYAPDAVVYDDAEVLCEEANIDAVNICSPTGSRRKLVEIAAEHGLGVFCQAPIAGTLTDALAVSDAVEEHGITFVPGQEARFSPAYRTAKARVDDRDLGMAGTVRTFRRGPPVQYSERAGNESGAGGVLLDLAIHDFDFLRWVTGDVERVFARRASWNGAEHALTTVRSGDDTVGHVDARWSSDRGQQQAAHFEIAGTEGHVEFDSEAADPVRVVGPHEATAERGPADEAPVADPYRPALEHFVDCLTTEQNPKVSVDNAVEAVRISLAAVESARTGTPVAPSEVAP